MLGTTFGPYRIQKLLGRGGMGEVYRAHDVERGRDVALKLLPAHLASDADYQERFRRECRAAARLNEPHIVPIHTFGEIDGRLFLDMRLVAGTDLATWLTTRGALPPEAAVSVVSQIAAALDAAHAAGLVHRDVKPSNILLAGATGQQVDRDVFAYLFDFGIARARKGMGGQDPTLTRTGTTPGSLAYTAPERFNGVEGDPRADVYALACVLHQALTGRPPFEGDAVALVGAHLSAPPPRPTQTRPELPPGLDDVVVRGMAKDPEERPASAGALAAATRAALDARPGAAAPARRAPVPTSVLPPGWSPSQPGRSAPANGRPGPVPLAVGAHAGWAGPPAHPYPPNHYRPGGGQPPAPSRWNGAIVVLAVVTAVAIAGGGIAWGVAAGGGIGGLGQPTTTNASTSPSTSTTPPSRVDELIEDLPDGYGSAHCAGEAALKQAVATVRCTGLPADGTAPGDGYFSRYDNVAAMNTDLEQITGEQLGADVPDGAKLDECADGKPVQVTYNRTERPEFGGELACYVAPDGGAVVAWTDDAAMGLGVVTRADGDIAKLYEWWKSNDFANDI